MTVTFISKDPCGVCGYRRAGVWVTSVRVNKRSIRSTGNGLAMVPGRCLECGRVTGAAVGLVWRMESDDARKVAQRRLRYWPELADEIEEVVTA